MTRPQAEMLPLPVEGLRGKLGALLASRVVSLALSKVAWLASALAAAAEHSARDYAPTPPQSPQPYKRHRKTSTRSPV